MAGWWSRSMRSIIQHHKTAEHTHHARSVFNSKLTTRWLPNGIPVYGYAVFAHSAYCTLFCTEGSKASSANVAEALGHRLLPQPHRAAGSELNTPQRLVWSVRLT